MSDPAAFAKEMRALRRKQQALQSEKHNNLVAACTVDILQRLRVHYETGQTESLGWSMEQTLKNSATIYALDCPYTVTEAEQKAIVDDLRKKFGSDYTIQEAKRPIHGPVLVYTIAINF